MIIVKATDLSVPIFGQTVCDCISSAGLDYSSDPFHSHVFLEHHLQAWCPQAGPIRHFMELVTNGLSRNPYLSSGKKVATLEWFRDYFQREENLEILVHAGYWQEEQQIQA